MVNSQYGKMQNLDILSVIFGLFDESKGKKNVLQIYFYGLVCGDVTLQICEMAARGLEGVCKIIAPLLHLKTRTRRVHTSANWEIFSTSQ